MSEQLTREIVNNTPLSPGDRIPTPSKLAFVGSAYTDGQVSRDALDYAEQVYESGGQLETLGSGGGGDGGGDGGGSPTPPPDPDPEPEPTPNRSQLSESLENVTSFSPERVTVFWSVSNTVTSGSGERLSGTVEITLDGQTQETQSVTVPAGGTRSGRVEFGGVSPGTREVCVRLQ